MPVRTLDAAVRRFGSPQRIGVALSGGGDSLALFHAALELAPKRGWELAALHVHHHLRPEAEREAEGVQRLVEAVGVPFIRLDLDPQSFTGNLHDAAREARYRALETAAAERHLEIVLTAHTLDDQAETLLQRLMRGTGPYGLIGIRERRGLFGRPWLAVAREELRTYLRQKGVNWFEDASNCDAKYTRTRIRHELLPLMAEIGGPKVPVALGRLARLAETEWQVLEEIAAAALQICRLPEGLDATRLAKLTPGRRALVWRRWFDERRFLPPQRVIQDVDNLACAPGPAGPYQLPGGGTIRKEGCLIRWEPEK